MYCQTTVIFVTVYLGRMWLEFHEIARYVSKWRLHHLWAITSAMFQLNYYIMYLH